MLEEGVELSNGEVAVLKGGVPRDPSGLWEGVKDVLSQFFTDQSNVHDMQSFARWFADVDCACIAFVNDKPVACAYVTGAEHDYKATFHAFAMPEYRTWSITVPLATKAMLFFMEKYSLEKLETIGRNDNRVARLLATKLGFEKEGVLKRHGMHDGKWIDYYVASIVS